MVQPSKVESYVPKSECMKKSSTRRFDIIANPSSHLFSWLQLLLGHQSNFFKNTIEACSLATSKWVCELRLCDELIIQLATGSYIRKASATLRQKRMIILNLLWLTISIWLFNWIGYSVRIISCKHHTYMCTLNTDTKLDTDLFEKQMRM